LKLNNDINTCKVSDFADFFMRAMRRSELQLLLQLLFMFNYENICSSVIIKIYGGFSLRIVMKHEIIIYCDI